MYKNEIDALASASALVEVKLSDGRKMSGALGFASNGDYHLSSYVKKQDGVAEAGITFVLGEIASMKAV